MRKTEERIRHLHTDIKALFPGAVAVRVFVNSEGIEVEPSYKADLNGISMKDINGNWTDAEELTE